MIITIDTKADSANDIRKAIAFLQLHVEDAPDFSYKSSSSSISPSSAPVDSTTMMNMFDDSPSTSSSSSQRISDGSAPDFSSFLNLTKEKTPANKVPGLRPQIEYF